MSNLENVHQALQILLSEAELAWQSRPVLDSPSDLATWDGRYLQGIRFYTRICAHYQYFFSSPFMAKMITIWNTWTEVRSQGGTPTMLLNSFGEGTPEAAGLMVDRAFQPLLLPPSACWWRTSGKSQ